MSPPENPGDKNDYKDDNKNDDEYASVKTGTKDIANGFTTAQHKGRKEEEK